METAGQRVLVGVAVTYMALIVIIPFLSVFVEAFRHGLGPFIETIQEPDFQQVQPRCLVGLLVLDAAPNALAWRCARGASPSLARWVLQLARGGTGQNAPALLWFRSTCLRPC